MKATGRLALIALGATLVSAGAFAGAYALATANDSGSSAIVSREIPWDGSSSLIVGVRSEVHYVQAAGPGKIVARGPQRSVATLVVGNGEIHDQLLHTGASLELTVFAPAITDFHLDGKSHLRIEAYDQPRLSLTTEGTAVVEASGRTDHVLVDMKGRSVVNLARLAADSATARLGGMSTLVVAPSSTADLDVRNFASTVLLSRPGKLSTALADSGRVVDAAGR